MIDFIVSPCTTVPSSFISLFQPLSPLTSRCKTIFISGQVEYYQKQENSLSIKVKELKETVGKYQVSYWTLKGTVFILN